MDDEVHEKLIEYVGLFAQYEIADEKREALSKDIQTIWGKISCLRESLIESVPMDGKGEFISIGNKNYFVSNKQSVGIQVTPVR